MCISDAKRRLEDERVNYVPVDDGAGSKFLQRSLGNVSL
jgi:hypothetical protein